MTIITRRVVDADLPALRELFLQAAQAAFLLEPSASRAPDVFDGETQGELVLVADDGERPVGFVSLWEADDFIHHLHVHPLCLRRGIGRALLRALPGWPTRRYRLKCLRLNASALAFYRACRFAQIGSGRAADREYLLLESDGTSRL